MGDTIFAQATARGRAGLAIIRISGPAGVCARSAALAGGLGPAAAAALRWLRDPATGARLDQAVVIAFPAPASFTGEDVVELQLHGSPAVVPVGAGGAWRAWMGCGRRSPVSSRGGRC